MLDNYQRGFKEGEWVVVSGEGLFCNSGHCHASPRFFSVCKVIISAPRHRGVMLCTCNSTDICLTILAGCQP